MKGIKALFRIRETYLGIAAAIAFQLIFFIVWMTAYDGFNDRMENLRVGLLNEDAIIGQEIANQIEENIPFGVERYTSLEQAKSDMDERKIEMIIQIPEALTESIQLGTDANIVYWINQSNASLTKTTMENVAVQLNEQVNRGIYSVQKNEAATMFVQQLQQFPASKEIADSVGQSVIMLLDSLNDRPVEISFVKTNAVDGFAANLVPLMIIMSSFVGAMVMIMQQEAAAQTIKGVHSKWALFIGRQMMNVVVAFLLPCLTMGLMEIFHISIQESLMTVYLFQAIMFWAFLSLAQVFVLVFDNIGMLFNILALSLQLVTSGVLVPKAMLSDWYIKLASFLPATYGAEGYYTIVFGGSSASIKDNILSLLIIIVVTLLISFGAVAAKRQSKATVVSNVSIG